MFMKNWFKDSEVFYEFLENEFTVGTNILKGAEKFKKDKTPIALIGINETISDSIRREFYQTSYSFKNIYLADLGNVRNTSNEFIIPILNELLNDGVNIILLGTDTNHFEAQLRSFNNNLFNLGFIEKSGRVLFDPIIQKLIKNTDKIHKAKLIGYQSHLFNTKQIDDKLYDQSIRLGQYRNNYSEIEPTIRDIDMAVFNLDSVRYSEVPGIQNTSPSGLTSEEACQIMKYLGLNTKTNLIDIIGFDPKYDFHNQGAMLISQLIWYYIEGVDNQSLDDTINNSSMLNYVIDLDDYNLSLEFLQSKKTGRWWVKIPKTDNKSEYFLPCNESDYIRATKNELSNRIFNELSL